MEKIPQRAYDEETGVDYDEKGIDEIEMFNINEAARSSRQKLQPEYNDNIKRNEARKILSSKKAKNQFLENLPRWKGIKRIYKGEPQYPRRILADLESIAKIKINERQPEYNNHITKQEAGKILSSRGAIDRFLESLPKGIGIKVIYKGKAVYPDDVLADLVRILKSDKKAPKPKKKKQKNTPTKNDKSPKTNIYYNI